MSITCTLYNDKKLSYCWQTAWRNCANNFYLRAREMALKLLPVEQNSYSRITW